MSIGYDSNTIQYENSGTPKTAFDFPGRFFDEKDLAVTLTHKTTGLVTPLILTTDYTVSLNSDPDLGGTIHLTVAPATTKRVTITRKVVINQDTKYPEGAAFPAASHERALDKLTMICQQINSMSSSTLRIDSPGKVLDPLKVDNNTVLSFGGDGEIQTLDPSGMRSFIALSPSVTAIDMPTLTFTNAGTRAGAAPKFVGQIGVQQDNGQLYIGTALTTGAWSPYKRGALQFPTPETLSAATPEYAGQLALRQNDGHLFYGTTMGAWAAVQSELGIGAASVTQTKLADDAKVFHAGARNLVVKRDTVVTKVSFKADELTLVSAAGDYKRFSGEDEVLINILELTSSSKNGLDAGSAASGRWYHIWAISDEMTLKGTLSLQQPTNNPDFGYTYQLYLGAAYLDASSNFVDFVQYNDRVYCQPQMVFTDRADTVGVYAEQVIDAQVPRTAVRVFGNCGRSSAGAADTIFYVAANAAGLGRSGGNARSSSTAAVDSYQCMLDFEVPLLRVAPEDPDDADEVEDAKKQKVFVKIIKASGGGGHYRMDVTGWSYNF